MSTFNGYISEFPSVRIDQFSPLPPPHPAGLVFLLSHAHTDHLRGLLSFRSPFIYCTHATRAILLRLTTRFHRLNFARGILESRTRSYAHLKRVLRVLPLNTPTELEVRPGEVVRVTALDANHCPGACMFLLQGSGRNVLYTGDVRAETWWVDALCREPVMAPFVGGLTTLDCIYLDTTFATQGWGEQWRVFPSKREGVQELLAKVAKYPPDTIFYLDTWTWGYEDVWVALAGFLGTKVHVDEYRWRMYRALAEGEGMDPALAGPLVGFQEGHRWQAGCLTREAGPDVRIHSCERGMGCEVFKQRNTVQIRAIITRYKGVEYTDNGEGGGGGDLNQMHELEVSDLVGLGKLIDVCTDRLKERPEELARLTTWLSESVKQGAQNIRLDTEAFYDAIGEDEGMGDLTGVPLDRIVLALNALVSEKKVEVKPSNWITFPHSRHASYEELRLLVSALKPAAVFPNTFEAGMDMHAMFGDLLSGAGTCAVEQEEQQQAASGEPAAPVEGPNEERVEARAPFDRETRKGEYAQNSAEGCLESATRPTLLVTEAAVQSPQTHDTHGHSSCSPVTPAWSQLQSARSSAKRQRPGSTFTESVGRRRKAFRAALEDDWSSVELISVKGYHNEQEEEL